MASAWIASYETASALDSRPGPEMGMATRHVLGLSHPVLPPHLLPMVGSSACQEVQDPAAQRSVQSQSLELRNQCGRHYGVKF